jgi:hypothetical protein
VSHIGKIAGRTNELTTISKIKTGHVELTRLTLENTAAIARAVLSDVETIHYACWVILPMNGEHYLVFVSNYTGTFDKYIDDFATTLKLGLGLDSIWWNCEIWEGVENVERLKDIIREQTTSSDLFYSAYPQATVRDVLKGLKAVGAVEAFLELE